MIRCRKALRLGCLAGLLVLTTSAMVAAAQTLAWPVDAPRIVVDYGRSDAPGPGKFHPGIDLTSAQSPADRTEVLAAGLGTVILLNDTCGTAGDTACGGGFGNYVVLRHGENLYSLYAHLSTVAVHLDDAVTAGQILGIMGATGATPEPRLYFSLLTSRPVTPADFGPAYTAEPPANLGFPDPRDYLAKTPVRVKAKTLMVRHGPAASEPALTWLLQGQEFVALARSSNNWHLIFLPASAAPTAKEPAGDRYGWVSGDFLELLPTPPAAPVNINSQELWKNDALSLRVRSGPGKNFGEVTRVWGGHYFMPVGNPMPGPGSTLPWQKIHLPVNAGAVEGWVAGDYLLPANIVLTVQASPPGCSYVVDGATYTSDRTFTWIAGSPHTLATTSPQAGAPGVQQVWTDWSDGGALTHTITPAQSTTYSARFDTEYYLTMEGSAGGTVTPASGWQSNASVVALSAAAAAGYEFTGWTGNGPGAYSGTNPAVSITVQGPITQSAKFHPLPPPDITPPVIGTFSATTRTVGPGQSVAFTFSVEKSGGSELGRVTLLRSSSPDANSPWSEVAGTNLSTHGPCAGVLTDRPPAPGTYWYDLTACDQAVPKPNCARATQPGAHLEPVTVMVPTNIAVQVQARPAACVYSVDGVTYSNSQTFTWTAGSRHALAATSPQADGPGVQYVGNRWSDDGALAHSISPGEGTTYTVSFDTQYHLTLAAGAGGTVTPASGWQAADAVVPLTATPNQGYRFVAWTGSGPRAYSGTNGSLSLAMRGPVTESAAFAVIPPPPKLAPSNQLTTTTSGPATGVKPQPAPGTNQGNLALAPVAVTIPAAAATTEPALTHVEKATAPAVIPPVLTATAATNPPPTGQAAEKELALLKAPAPKPVTNPTVAPPPDVAPLLAEAQRFIAAGKFEQAQGKYLEVLRQDGKNVPALSSLATLQLERNQLPDAERHFKQALALAPADSGILLNFGRLQFQQKKYDEALDALNGAAKLDPKDAKVQNILGLVLIEKGTYGPAEAALRKAIELQPGYGNAHHNMAVLYLTQQPPFAELARWHYQKALQLSAPRDLDLEKILDAAKP